MKKMIRNERGSMVILTIGTLFFVGLLLLIVVNIGKMYIVKEQASMAAEQASIAASSVVYDEIREKVIDSYVYKDKGETVALKELFLKEKKRLKSANGSLSDAEANKKAIDNVLMKHLKDDQKLRKEVERAVGSAFNRIPQTVDRIISENHGHPQETRIIVFDQNNRIEVQTAVEFNNVEFGKIIRGNNELIPNVGKGVRIPFISNINWRSQVIDL